ncbi:MAG TPA: acetyl-CoA carboxylase biotin carboxylase subunit [Terriglobia bacterium]|nr:acetyl-CoA carboxylase biotin carboxylase subunit [Terriglobia bacterium]
MFKKVLVANRGEIALRVICACKELGIQTVAVYSQADANSLHVRFADEAVCIGPPRPTASYLNVPSIISAAEITSADAIHPGYGLLAEAPNFAEVCETCGISFIGPRPEIIRLMGNKKLARKKMAQMGLPVLPGSEGPVSSPEEATAWAEQIGYPVLIKAVHGGGGRGMRCVQEAEEMPKALEAARREALQAFGYEDVYIEKMIPRARHIEFQVLADQYGRVLHLGERECSIQRRFQKILEEAPAAPLSEERRRSVGAVLERILAEVNYTNAGTVEFLMDQQGQMYFIEMNTRIQVEHPVTEMVTGIDLVKSQILLAAGARLSEITDAPVAVRGHSIECRILAENPVSFAPSTGKVTAFHVPGGTGVRVDSACYEECVIDSFYDSLIGKLIVHGRDRQEAISRMQRALEMFIVEGVKTSLPLHQKIVAEPDFLEGNYHVGFLERYLPHATRPAADSLAERDTSAIETAAP